MHQYQSTRSNLLVGSWHTGILLQPTLAPGQHHPDTLLLSECITPTSHVSAMQGIWVSNGTIKAVFARGGEQALATELDPVSGYSPATKYTMRWQGATLAGEPCTITVRGERPKADACVNMLGELPFLLRKIVQALVAKPYSYMYVDGGVKAEVECAGVKSVIEGTFYRESTFVNKA